MNDIYISSTVLPVLCGCDFCAASEPFLHADRTVDFNVMIYVTNGCIYVTEENAGGEIDYEIRRGELLFLKSGKRHYGKKPCPKGTSWYFAHFCIDGEQKHPLFEVSDSGLIQYERVENSVLLPKFMTGLGGGEPEKQISGLIEYFHSDDRTKRWNINARLFGLLTEIAFFGCGKDAAQSLSDKICRYLNRRYAEPFSAKVLEGEFFLSYKHMAAVFKKEKGLTMQQFHTKARMNAACKLLRSTLLPIGEISERVGYSDRLYFSRCFRNFIGLPPTEYRRLNTANY